MEKLKPNSNLDKGSSQRKKRKQFYDNSIKPALVRMWKIFDCPCGQRLETLLKSETDKLRLLGEVDCSDNIAVKLKTIGSATIDRKLRHQKEVEHQKKKYDTDITHGWWEGEAVMGRGQERTLKPLAKSGADIPFPGGKFILTMAQSSLMPICSGMLEKKA